MSELDFQFYREAYLELGNLSDHELEEHYRSIGINSGYFGNFDAFTENWANRNLPANFDFQDYLFLNPDLPFATSLHCQIHYYYFGRSEKRKIKIDEIYLEEKVATRIQEFCHNPVKDPNGKVKNSFLNQIINFDLTFKNLDNYEITRAGITAAFECVFEEILTPSELNSVLRIAQIKFLLNKNESVSVFLAIIHFKLLSIHNFNRNSQKDSLYFQPMGGTVTYKSEKISKESQFANQSIFKLYLILDELLSKIQRIVNILKISFKQKNKVTIITSIYNGENFIEQFLKNVTRLKGFSSCELILVDSNSPQNEYFYINKFQNRFKNIKYIKVESNINIYEAWNVAINMAKGDYITTFNLDDRRLYNYLPKFASALSKNEEIDVVYGNMFYSFKENSPVAITKRMGVVTNLPIVSSHNLLEFNSPNCAPMWRKSIHNLVGLFSEEFKIAGDLEFWLRCASRNIQFGLVVNPLIIYFRNPHGLSTRNDESLWNELRTIRTEYRELLINEEKVLGKIL